MSQQLHVLAQVMVHLECCSGQRIHPSSQPDVHTNMASLPKLVSYFRLECLSNTPSRSLLPDDLALFSVLILFIRFHLQSLDTYIILSPPSHMRITRT